MAHGYRLCIPYPEITKALADEGIDIGQVKK